MKKVEAASTEKPLIISWLKDLKYPISAGAGTFILILTIILVHFFKGETTWLEIIIYPLLVYFTFQQVLSGFGFITGYIPTAIDIINWLSKTAAKKTYCEDDIKNLERHLCAIEEKEKEGLKKLEPIKIKQEKKKGEILNNQITGKWSQNKVSKEQKKWDEQQRKLENETNELTMKCLKKKEIIKKKQKEYRGKFSERIITKQQEITPVKFKIIMLAPIYIMLIVGLILTLISLINPIIRLTNGVEIPAINKLDMVNEIYKGIVATWGLINFYILPAIRIYRDPTREYVQKMKVVTVEKKKFFFFKRVEEVNDFKTVLNRQFEDLRRYYWKIKQIIGKALLIPIGFSMLIAAPIGALSITLGIQTSIRRKQYKKHELLMLIIIAVTLICFVFPSYLTFQAHIVKSEIHDAIPIVLRLLYGTFLIISFVAFTKHPIARVKDNQES